MAKEFAHSVQYVRDLTKEQFEGLLHISRLLNSAAHEQSLLEQALDWVIDVINAERGLVVKYSEADNAFSMIAARNIHSQSITDLSEFSSGILQQVIQTKHPVLYHDAQSDPTVSQFTSIQIRRIKSIIGVPIMKDDRVWGVILADSQTNRKEFTEANLLFLSFFSNLVSLALDKIARLEMLQDENQRLLNRLQASDQLPDIVGESPKMRDLARIIHRVARTDATVLLLGESGTGKDLVAQAIHKLSARKNKPYLAQFCGSIPDTLLESELFGYKKGAFTGATSDKKGLLEVADKGTFFLDEIADISGALQAKLLRVLENREIIRLGDTEPRKIDVRIIAATNRDLQQLTKAGKFREDLFYRLNVFPIKLPPLRERREDIAQLVSYCIAKQTTEKVTLTPRALKKLEGYFWPGNVRQLFNVIQRALILREGNTIDEGHLIFENEKDLTQFTGTLEDFERLLLKKRLEEFNGNRTLTAQSLGVSVRWVQMKLKEQNEP